MTKRNPFAKDLPEMAQGLREQATSGTEGGKGTELRPCDSEALTERERQGFKAAIAQRDATIERAKDVLFHCHADTCATELSPNAGYECTCWRGSLIEALQAADDRRAL